MNLAESAANRELIARVVSLESKVADLTRRMDDQSKAHRVIADDIEKTRQTLTLKKANG